jgi:hypothetical protein
MAKRTPAQDEIFSKVLKDFEEDLGPHKDLITKYDERYRAFRGIIEPRSQAAMWTNKLAQKHVASSIETAVASLLDPSPKWRLRACPIMGKADEIERLRDGARANELLLSHQLVIDKYAEKQRTFDLQGLILGTTGAKQYWVERRGLRHHLETVDEPVYGMYDQVIGSVPRTRQKTTDDFAYRDDPTTEVVDMRDLVLPENAISLERCPRVQHVMWLTYDELKRLEADGIYGPKAGGEPIDLVKEGKGFSSDAYNREQELFGVKRTKDLIKVVESWTEYGERAVTFANHAVLLSDKPNPFWFDHLDHKYPFVIASPMPDMFRIPGISEVEMMAEIQEMLWTLGNQRLDALQLLSNAIFLIADDVEDPDSFEFGPGERWLVPRPVDETIKPWSPDPNVPNMTLQAEGLLKQDLQNVTGGLPFLGGAESQSIDQQTATGVSIVTSLAQKRLAAKKQQFTWAKGRIGEQWCALNQQFVRSPRLVPVVGTDGASAFEEIRPDMIQGVYSFSTEMVEESMMRQERRAEAQAKLQVAVNAVGVWAPLAQAGTVPMLNLKAFMDDYLEAFDVGDKERYYSAKAPQVAPPTPGQPQPGQPQGAPGQNGQGGATSPLATNPTAPSNSESMSPEVFMQQMLAGQGGPVNGG